MICLITPTGNRIDQFKICTKWMHRQDYTGKVLWIIVDDGPGVTTNSVQPEFRADWEIVKVYPKPVWAGTNTQGRNLKAGIDALTSHERFKEVRSIFIIEDDDYYKPVYLTEMVGRMKNFSLIGETNTVYYNVQWRQYCDNNNRQHSSLFQTAFRPDQIALFVSCLQNKWIDADMWAKATNKHLFHAGMLSLGIKGMPGRGGIGAGHKRTMSFIQDQSLQSLKQLIGEEDAEVYAKYYSSVHNTQHGLLYTKGR